MTFPAVSVAEREGSASNRFGQLTYSSFDDGTGVGGGWQVKDVAGGLTDAEREVLRFWVQTTFEPPKPLPPFPTPEDVARFPRRLMYTRLPDGQGGYWHTAPAGADGSGRPGNVFAHTVLDRTPHAGDVDLRPIELWRSPDWLAPYGAGDVVAAKLTSAELPAPRAVVNRQSVIEFLCDPAEWRVGVLSVLLDAVAAAMNGGPAVVFGARSVDTAAMWIGAVSHLMSGGTARRFGWSTFDRAAGVQVSVGRGVHLISVPLDDVDAVPNAESMVVLREDEVPAIGDLGGDPHRTAAGSVVPVSEWSVMAQVALLEPAAADHALRVMDDVAGSVTDVGLAPAWPLAMAVAMIPDLREDVGTEAGAVIARHSPDDLNAKPELAELASTVIGESLGSSAADAWAVLESTQTNRTDASVTVELLVAVYVERALRDVAWLTQPGGVPFVHHRLRDGWTPHRLGRVVADRLAELDERARTPNYSGVPSGGELAFEVFRTLDLVVRANCVEPAGAAGFSGLERCQNLFEMVVAPALFEPETGPRFVGVLGRLDEETATKLVRPVVATAPPMNRGVLGRRIATGVLTWLMPPNWDGLPSAADLAALPPDGAHPLAALVAELTSQHLADPQSSRNWSQFNWLALWRLLAQHGEPGVQLPDFRIVFGGVFDPAKLNVLLARYPGIVPPRFLMQTLIFEPVTDDYHRLPASLLAPAVPGGPPPLTPPGEADAVAAAIWNVRARADWRSMPSAQRTSLLERFYGPALREALAWDVARLPPDLVHTLAVLGVVSAVEYPSRAEYLDAVKLVVRAENVARRTRLIAALADLTRPDGIPITWLVEAALVGADEAPERRLARAPERFVCSLTRSIEDRPVSLLDEVVDLLVDGNRYGGPTDPEAIEREMRNRVSRAYPGEEDKILGLYRKFARKWLDERGLGPGGVMNRLRRK